MTDLSQEQIKCVVSSYLLGVSHFGEDRSQTDVLGQLFCFAVHHVLEEEQRGTGRSRAEILTELAERTREQVLPDTHDAFVNLREEEFSRLFDAVLAVAEEAGLARDKLVEGLASVNEIIDYFGKLEADDASP